MLTNSLKNYFPDLSSNNMWIKDSFSVEIEKEETFNLSEQEVDKLIEISYDTDFKKVFETTLVYLQNKYQTEFKNKIYIISSLFEIII